MDETPAETTPAETTPTEMIDIFDERAQANIDAETLVTAVTQIRKALGVAKVNKALAQLGLLEGPDLHPEKFKAEIAKNRKALELLKQMWDKMTPEGLPEATIDTYEAVPRMVLTEPTPIA